MTARPPRARVAAAKSELAPPAASAAGPDLAALARAAMQTAYAPYSGFHVGCALVTRTGEVFTGANVENASYGLCVCAERSALLQMAIAGHRDVAELWVATDIDPPASPCGMCRQTLLEFTSDPHGTRVVAIGSGATRAEWTVAALIPAGFTGAQLTPPPRLARSAAFPAPERPAAAPRRSRPGATERRDDAPRGEAPARGAAAARLARKRR